MKHGKRVETSRVEKTEIVLPNDTNVLGNLLGGKLMHWIDIAGAIAAGRHSGTVVVTASVDELNFLCPIKLGEVVILKASVNRVFNSSMEVGVKVYAQNLQSEAVIHANSAYLTFVALDHDGTAVKICPLIVGDGEEKRRYDDALIRRNHRLKRRTYGGNRCDQ